MDMEMALFRRLLVRRHIDHQDEEKSLLAEELTVTKEVNGYALWYSSDDYPYGRIIAWARNSKDDLIAHAVRMHVEEARMRAEEGPVNYQIPKQDDQALEPVVEKS